MLTIDAVTQKHMDEREKMRELEYRREGCAFSYMRKNGITGGEDWSKVIQAFYISDNPEDLMSKDLDELFALLPV